MAPQTRTRRGEVGTIGGGGKGNETTSNPDISDSSDDTSDDSSDHSTPVARPDKDTVLAHCFDMKKEFQVQSKEKLESLAPFLIQKGALAGRTCQETYHRALVDLIERNRPLPVAVAKEFSQGIGQYVAMRLYNTAKIILPLLSVHDWDTTVVGFILELIEDLNDIELKVPQFQAISALGDCYRSAPQGSKALIADPIEQHVLQWIRDSASEYEMMRVWATSPSWIIHTGKHDRSRISF